MRKMAIVGVMMLLATSTQATAMTRNLLTNPGAEDGNTSGWTTDGNIKAVRVLYQTTGVVEELSGDYFFEMGLGREFGPSSMSQKIDLSAFAASTLVSFKAGGHVQTELWPPMSTAFDRGKLIIEFFDDGDNALGQSVLDRVEHPVLGGSEAGSDYGEFSLTGEIPSDTSYAVVTLEGHVFQGVYINVFYDDLFFAVDVDASLENSISVNGQEAADRVETELGDHLTVTLKVVNPHEDPIKVENVLPDELRYIPYTLAVGDGDAVTPSIADNTISTMVPNGAHEITFHVQVVEVYAEQDGTVVTSEANIYDPAGDKVVNCAAVDIKLCPYAGFSRGVERCTNDPWNAVPTETDVHWLLLMEVWNVLGDRIGTMENIVVHDLEVEQAATQVLGAPSSSGTVSSERMPETKKVHLTWEVGDLEESDPPAQLWVEIGASLSLGEGEETVDGHEEYATSREYALNSGAVVRFTDPETGFQLSAHTSPLVVAAVE